MSQEITNTGPGDQPLVDFEQLKSVSNDDRDLMQELINLYFTQADEVMEGLRAALASGTADEVDHLSHKLVGASLACGMTAMVAPLRELERRGKVGNLAGGEGLFADAGRYLQLTREEIERYLKSGQ